MLADPMRPSRWIGIGGPREAPVRPVVLLLQLAVSACGDDPCPRGSYRANNGLCTLPDEEPAGDDGADGGDGTSAVDTGDTGAPVTWHSLPESCEPPDALGAVPITLTGELDVQRHAFVEFVDLVVNTDRGLAFGAGQGGFVVTDISDPANPRFLAADAPLEYFQRFYRVAEGPNNIVYTTHRDIGLVAWDTTDASNPRVTHKIEGQDFSGMAVSGEHPYLATHTGTLITFDLGRPDIPNEVSRAEGFANGWQPTVVGDRLYIADNTDGVVVFDLTRLYQSRTSCCRPGSGSATPAASADPGSTRR